MELASLKPQLDALSSTDLMRALDEAMLADQRQFWQGLTRYQQLTRDSELPDYNTPYRTLWRNGPARLLAFGPEATEQPPLFIIPSLLNRAHILDLTPERSLIASLTQAGRPVLLLDWGEPTPDMHHWESTHYIQQQLLPALAHAQAHHPSPHLLGHCMGGLFALAATQRAETPPQSLTLLSTPWDFSPIAAPMRHYSASQLESWLNTLIDRGRVMSRLLQPLFYLHDPTLFARKFQQLAVTEPASGEESLFVALERWVNDAGHLTAALTRETFLQWGKNNSPLNGNWRIDDVPVTPASLTLPVQIIVAARDAVVPPASTEPLARLLPQAAYHRFPGGHAGILVGQDGLPALTQTLLNWLGKDWTNPR